MARNGSTTDNLRLFIAQVLLLAGLYFVAGQASFSLFVSHTVITLVVFASEGFALAALILWGTRLWLGVFLGQLVLALYNGLALPLALGLSVTNSLEAIIGARLFYQLALQPAFSRMRDVSGLLILIFFVLQPFSATLSLLCLWLGDVVPSAQLGELWLTWWFANALGQASITPLVLSFFGDKKPIKPKLQGGSWLLLFSIPISIITLFPTSFSSITIAFTLTIPLLILIAAKGGMSMVTLATAILTITTLFFTRSQIMENIADGEMTLLLDLNTHVLATVLTGQFVAALLAEYKQVQLAQHKASEHLQKIADHFPGAIYQFQLNPDNSFCFPYASVGIQDIYHLSPEEIQEDATKIFKLVHSEDYQQVMSSITLSAQNLTPWQCDYRVRFADGTIRWLSGHAIPQREKNGAILWYGFKKDVTEIKQKEVEYQTVIEASFSGFFCCDFSGRFLTVNTALCNMLAYSQQELLNMSIADIEAVESATDIAAHIQAIIQIGHDRFETQHRRKDGSVIDVEINSLYVNALGQRFFVFVNDISERKQMELELHNSHEELRHYFDQPFIGMLTATHGKHTRHVNQRFCEIVGYSQEEMQTIDWGKLTHPDDLASNQAYLDQAIRGEIDSYQMEKRYIHKDGHIVYIDLAVYCVRKADGQPDYFIGMMLDITERKRVENALQEKQALLQTAQRAARMGHYVLDLRTMVWTNDALFDEICGIDSNFVHSMTNWQSLVHPDDLQYVMYAFRQILNGYQFNSADSIDSINYRIIRPNDGVELWIEAWAYNFYDAHNNPIQQVGIIQDITERKRMEEALKASEAFTASILNSLTEHIVVLNEQGRIIMFNQAWQQFAEQNGLTLKGQSMLEHDYLRVCQDTLQVTHNDEINTISQGITDVLMGERQEFHTEYPCHSPTEQRWFYMSVSPLKGVQSGVVISHENISKRKLVENALLDSQALLNTAQRAARMGHYVTDLSTKTWTNDSIFDEIFGIDERFNRNFANWQQIMFAEDAARVIDYFSQSAQNHEDFPHIEYRIIRPSDGVIRWIAAWGYNFFDQNNRPIQQVGMIQDITERKLAEQELQKTTEQLQLVLEGGHLGFWDWNLVTRKIQRNAIWAEMLGYGYDEIESAAKKWEDFIHPDDREKAWQSIYDVLENRSPYHETEYRMLHKDGSIKWILDHASIVQRDANGKPTRMSGTHTDITKLKRLEEKLRESENFFSSLAQVNPIGIYRTDAQGSCIYVNRKGCEIIGMTRSEAEGEGWRNAIMVDDREKVYNEWMTAVQEQRQFALEYRIQTTSGKITWVYGLATAIHDETGNISGYVGTITDITERKATEEYINHLAFYDPLTQLPNRRLLQERLKHGIEINHRIGTQMAVLMMDLDKFKAVNDNLGHAAGDELLQQVALRIKARLREVDMVARLGGDEFVVLMENVEHSEYVARVADDIIYALAQPFTLYQNHEVYIGTSIGIAIHPQHGDSVDALMDNADTALYHAKDLGRGCFAYFSEQLTQKARERIALETRLRNAITQQELRVYFQPQIEIHSDKLIGAEALVRWYDPIHGRLSADNFLKLAEETRLIIAVGEWVLQETCRIGRQWLNQGLPPVILAVNISPYQFRRSDINALVTKILDDTQFPAEYLELEITESGLIENQEHALSILNALHDRGVRLAIDDFGTGYSSLASLKYFPVDTLKIDKSFISDISDSQDDRAITSTVITMAHNLSFKVLAEGVETEEQLAFLRTHHCDMYQGYLCSKPLSADDFEKMLQSIQ